MAMPDTLVRMPVYQQLNEHLRRHLLGLQPGDRFLTEREIAERFQVSRATANKALAALVGEGLIEFRKGLGTFVRPSTLAYDLRALVSFTAQAIAAGRTPATRVLAFDVCEADAVQAATLGVSQGAPLWRMERLRLLDGVPSIVETRLVVRALCPELAADDCGGSLYDLWMARGLHLAGAVQTVSAAICDPADAAQLQRPAGSALLVAEAVGRVAGGTALWHERTRYAADHWRFTMHLGGPSAAPRPTLEPTP
jgi:GntR family transcriptional regulator